jgi:hypothetical protein
MGLVVSYESAPLSNADAYARAMPAAWPRRSLRLHGPAEWASNIVDNIRLFFAYTVAHVPRARELEMRGGSLQGLRREYPGARRDDAVTARRSQVPALP